MSTSRLKVNSRQVSSLKGEKKAGRESWEKKGVIKEMKRKTGWNATAGGTVPRENRKRNLENREETERICRVVGGIKPGEKNEGVE